VHLIARTQAVLSMYNTYSRFGRPGLHIVVVRGFSRERNFGAGIVADCSMMAEPITPVLPLQQPPRPKRAELSKTERVDVLCELLMSSRNDIVERGCFVRVGKKFGKHRSTISRLWERACKAYLGDADLSLSVRSLQHQRRQKNKPRRQQLVDEHYPFL
jgi:hypothetical protein